MNDTSLFGIDQDFENQYVPLDVAKSLFFRFEHFSEDDFEASVKGHLRILLLPRLVSIWCKWLNNDAGKIFLVGDFDKSSNDVANENILMISAMCALGLVAYKYQWRLTPAWNAFASLYQEEQNSLYCSRDVEILATWWSGRHNSAHASMLHKHFVESINKAWEVMESPVCQTLLRQLISKPIGISHTEFLLKAAELGIKQPQAMLCAAASLLVGAVDFNGRNWKPKLFAASIIDSNKLYL